MSGGQPASLDSSLLARKGDATPAIQDQSPLVLRLEPNLPEPDKPTAASENDGPPVKAGVRFLTKWRSEAMSRLASARPGLRLAAIAATAAVVVAGLWLFIDGSEKMPQQAASGASAVPAADADNQSLQLSLTSVPEAPEPPSEQAVAADPSPDANAALPAAAALAATEPSDELPAAEPPATTLETAAPAGGAILPVKAPSSEVAPPVGDLDAVPDIPAVVPKSVAPVPVPKAKPELPGASAGAYAVQLASIAVEERAQEEAFRLQKQLGAVLGGREIKVERAVVAGKGTWYRLRAGGFQSLAEARAACAQAVKLKANCLAIRR